ncbi:MAG: diacylglycerol kinase [Parcubacteria group bacterium Gr01-1014_48]|nr:MAG: diacylglycerol kinase [Parcubacteria group bacterium Greene0416_14]TSC74350.1 MAG: diacylglycerol kinase [Parcubacteria group bacterium Gr01-1014_48]TSD00733.1 MAG: diacylglycerol kinase [Parcubacteria group bacterium Greene1014_15]TSD07855.1 MAG: diacylglycerol kinase [Parcubacteria group bacterium Greene0714_4]
MRMRIGKVITKIIDSFRNAFRGVRDAFRHDLSFRFEVFGGFGVLLFAVLFWPLRIYELLFLLLSYTLILMTELMNTAVEQLLERLHPQRHELIGRGKDIASAAVLMAFTFLSFICVLIVLRHVGILP